MAGSNEEGTQTEAQIPSPLLCGCGADIVPCRTMTNVDLTWFSTLHSDQGAGDVQSSARPLPEALSWTAEPSGAV